jgi:acyl-CoA synthetase (NDP forming)
MQDPAWRKEIHAYYGTKANLDDADADDEFADDPLGQSSG